MKTFIKLALIPLALLIFSFISKENSLENTAKSTVGFWNNGHDNGAVATYEQITFNADNTYSLDVTSIKGDDLNYYRIIGDYQITNGTYTFTVDSYRVNDEAIDYLKTFDADFSIENNKLTVNFPEYLGGTVTFEKM